MKKLMISVGGAALLALALGATAFAAAPDQVRSAGTAIADLLGLTQAQVHDLRQDGLSLEQIAQKQDVDPATLVDAMTTRWTERIDARVAAGALTADEAAQLKAQLETRAREMITRTQPGGMGGAAVGAGRMGGNGAGAPYGDGTCDGTGPHGPGGR